MNDVSMGRALAEDGGPPVRQSVLPCGRQWVGEDDIESVLDALRSELLTTGPTVDAFEAAFADLVSSRHAVALSSGTAALHAAVHAAGIGPGDEVIVPPLTFAATANCVVFQRGTPVFANVEPETLLLDPDQVQAKVTSKTKAVIAVDYAGHPCDYDRLSAVAAANGLVLIDDACHALGGTYRGRAVGSLAGLSVFSFHPVKHLTTGEGGMVTTEDPDVAARMRTFRNHGITTDHRQRAAQGTWFYEMVDLGYNYRITDFQCALGLSQMRKLRGWVLRRQEIAGRYDQAFDGHPGLDPLRTRSCVSHAYHLYVVRLRPAELRVGRAAIFSALRAEGIGVNVHYIPVHLHPYYRRLYGTRPGQCPVAEAAYEEILTLPIFPAMTEADVDDVIQGVRKVLDSYSA